MESAYNSWEVNNEGFIFRFDPRESGTVNVYRQILNQLVDEDRAVVGNGTVVIPHKVIAELPEDERITLELPDPFPFTIEIKASGSLSSENLKYVYFFCDGYGQPFRHTIRMGTHLEVDQEQRYLITGQLYWLIEAIDSFNARKTDGLTRQEAIKNNLLVFVKIKGLARATGAFLDLYLNEEQVVAPTGISVRLHRVEGDTIEIEPVLIQAAEADQRQPITVLNDDQQASFLKVFDRIPTVHDSYAIQNGPRIVLNDKTKEALKPFKRYRRVSGEVKDAILSSPQLVFDPEVVDLDNFSDRVIEIGEQRRRTFPFLRPFREAWLPEEEGETSENQRLPAENSTGEHEADEIKDLETADLPGEAAHVTHREGQADRWTDGNVAAENEPDYPENRPSQTKKHGLIIIDNFDELGFEADKQKRSSAVTLPRNLRPEVQLLKHQEMGIHWLQEMYLKGFKGALLADDMGLGKTLQALVFLAWVAECNEAEGKPHKPMLIVAPVALLENWNREYQHFLNPLFGPLVHLHGSGLNSFQVASVPAVPNKDLMEVITKGQWLDCRRLQKCGAVLTTYETLRDYQVPLGLVDWAVMVLDECQKIKNPTALVTLAAKAMKYDFGLCLTGTPVENSLVELWSILDFAYPGNLGSLKEFVAKYHTPMGKPGTDREKLALELRSHVSSLMLRRLKDEYLQGLPQKQVHLCPMEMPPEQVNKYRDIIKRARQTLPDRYLGNRKEHIFKTIQALRRVSLHPYLDYDERALEQMSDEAIICASARLSRTMEILDQVKDKKEKAIVFLIDRKLQRVLQRLLHNRYGLHASIINGEVTGPRRQLFVDSFQKGEGFNVIIMSPEAAGVGLNITAANHVIHLSREWNPAKEDQATDRVYRIGQQRTVHVYIPQAVHTSFGDGEGEGTFDQKLHRLLESKRQLSRTVLMPAVIEEREWQQLGEELLRDADKDVESDRGPLSMSDIDKMRPDIFESAIAALYRKMGYEVFRTPASGDMGADVVALSTTHPSYLIQCKHHLDPTRLVGIVAVQEINSAPGVYEMQYNTRFSKVVITNAVRFSDPAAELARSNGVELFAREDLMKMLEKSPISWADLE